MQGEITFKFEPFDPRDNKVTLTKVVDSDQGDNVFTLVDMFRAFLKANEFADATVLRCTSTETRSDYHVSPGVK